MRKVLITGVLSALATVGSVFATHEAAATDLPADVYFNTWDDFQHGFTEAGTSGASAKWFYFSFGSFVGNDGIAETSSLGLRVRAPGTNPTTHQPAFTSTVAPEEQSGLPGLVDHVKWLVYGNHTASSGYPGWDAAPNRELSCMSVIAGRTYGTQNHPFGSAVKNANDDLRLASFAMNSLDYETFMVFDTFVSNQTIYAFYERLPVGRGEALGNYAAFSYTVPIAPYSPLQPVLLQVAYDRSKGTVRWLVNGIERFKVDKIGFRLPSRQFMTLDHGGTETLVSPRQIDCGMGMFTLLDGHYTSNQGLVRLSSAQNFYFNPEVGEPTLDTFFDENSSPQSRLFGQGAELRVFRYFVASLPD